MTSAELLLVPRSYSPDGLVLAIPRVSSTMRHLCSSCRRAESRAVPGHARSTKGGLAFPPTAAGSLTSRTNRAAAKSTSDRFPKGAADSWSPRMAANYAAWNPEGGELFYQEGNRIMVVDVETGADVPCREAPRAPRSASRRRRFNFQVRSRCLPTGSDSSSRRRSQYASAPTQINVVLNWFSELERLVPTR